MDTFTRWLGGGFLAAGLFWFGVSYNRLNAIETQLITLQKTVADSIPSTTAIAVLNFKVDQLQREMDAVKRTR